MQRLNVIHIAVPLVRNHDMQPLNSLEVAT